MRISVKALLGLLMLGCQDLLLVGCQGDLNPGICQKHKGRLILSVLILTQRRTWLAFKWGF